MTSDTAKENWLFSPSHGKRGAQSRPLAVGTLSGNTAQSLGYHLTLFSLCISPLRGKKDNWSCFRPWGGINVFYTPNWHFVVVRNNHELTGRGLKPLMSSLNLVIWLCKHCFKWVVSSFPHYKLLCFHMEKMPEVYLTKFMHIDVCSGLGKKT